MCIINGEANMSTGRRMDKVNIFVVMMILVLSLVADIIMVSSVEQEKRMQARFNLEQIAYCYNETKGKIGIKESLRICTNKSKTSHTGDVYVLDANTLEFVHENSHDVPREKLYFTKESIGAYFKDWESGKKAIDMIKLRNDSVYGLNNKYNFDGEIEWLEWKILPNDTIEPGEKLIVVQGIQRDEVMARYSYLRIYVATSVCIIVMILLGSYNINIMRRKVYADKRAR